ncbi:hypothetical protein [Amycolatopsis samaneae]|uniref:CDP-Glycerol:Poly(Glycerophosphate) glycerophosphotransferase n=1 Tax=Amycolatopsis samaneae TaxID=664691 RepID=A0ABW5GG51_9PSEU
MDVRRRVLVVVRTVTTLTRLLDLLSLIESDRRVQVVFTHDERAPAIFAAGVPEALAELEASVIPWDQAVASRFDLAIAASENDALHRLNAPVLLVPHGIGHQKYYPRGTVVSGLDPARLVHGGRVVPARIGLSHSNQLRQLDQACPPALPHAVVIGDPCHDRLLASTHRLARYRRALGTEHHTHVVLASTWGPDSLLGSRPELPERLLAELPYDGYRVSMVLHPGVWAAHGPRQVRAWLAAARRSGLAVLPPHRGWQATLLAADCVVSDCGSLPLYAAAAGIPVLIGSPGADTVVPGSPLAELLGRAARLDDRADLRAQIDQAATGDAFTEIAAQAVEYSGKCAEVLRPLLYELMDLPEPEFRASFRPLAEPLPARADVSAFVAGVRADGDLLDVSRFPAELPRRSGRLPYQHVLAHDELSTLAELDGATIDYRETDAREFPGWARATARLRPDARLLVGVTRHECLVWTPEGDTVELTTDSTDPLPAVSALYWRARRDLPLTGRFRYRAGHRVHSCRIVSTSS